MPIAILGVVWPELRRELDRPSGSLGWLITAYGAGRLLSSSWGGFAVQRFGMRSSMVAASLALVAAVGGVALTAGWLAIVGGLFAIGLVSGLLDSLGNRYVALSGSIGQAGLVAGTYGVGATLGPAASTLFEGWRVPFAIATVAAVLASVFVVAVGDGWVPLRSHVPHASKLDGAPPAGSAGGPARLGLFVSLGLFFVFVSIEVGAGSWLATYLEDHRTISGGLAGLAVTMFWAGLTVGRLALGTISRRVRVAALLPAVPIVVAIGFVLVATAPSGVVVIVVAVVGAALSPTMPTLIASTASRVGQGAVSRVTGWQLVAANVGAISVPALIGLLVDRIGPGVTPVVLGSLAVAGMAPLVWASRRALEHGS